MVGRISLLSFVFLALLAGGPGRAAPGEQPLGDAGEVNGIRYASGGVGAGERTALQGMAAEFNLKVVLAERGGAFVSDVPVVVENQSGQRIFEHQAQGPWLFVKLPPGTYRVAATKGTTQEKTVKVAAAGQAEIHFYWAGEK